MAGGHARGGAGGAPEDARGGGRVQGGRAVQGTGKAEEDLVKVLPEPGGGEAVGVG